MIIVVDCSCGEKVQLKMDASGWAEGHCSHCSNGIGIKTRDIESQKKLKEHIGENKSDKEPVQNSR